MVSPQISDATEDGISDELSSLRIVNPNDEPPLSPDTPTQSKNPKRRLSVRFALLPAGSLASLSSTSSEIMERLLQPGMMSNVSDAEDGQNPILQWRQSLDGPASPSEDNTEALELAAEAERELHATDHASSRTRLSRLMPCTLQTPTPSLESAAFRQHSSDNVDMNKTDFLDPEPERKPLARTMSADERSLFLDNLTQSSGVAPAMLFSVPLIDLKTVRRDAENLGFNVRVLPNGSSQEHRWVILAKEEGAAKYLETRLMEEEEKGRKAKMGAGHLGAAASGALVGAVATFTGLAFA